MCGRCTIRRPGGLAKLVYQGKFEEFSDIKIEPRFNVAPSQLVPVARLNKDDKRVINLVIWGLIPFFTKGAPQIKPINARAETVATSGMYRQAFARRCCLQLADGFYEWKKIGKQKQPYLIKLASDTAFAFAAFGNGGRVMGARCPSIGQ